MEREQEVKASDEPGVREDKTRTLARANPQRQSRSRKHRKYHVGCLGIDLEALLGDAPQPARITEPEDELDDEEEVKESQRGIALPDDPECPPDDDLSDAESTV